MANADFQCRYCPARFRASSQTEAIQVYRNHLRDVCRPFRRRIERSVVRRRLRPPPADPG